MIGLLSEVVWYGVVWVMDTKVVTLGTAGGQASL